MRLLQVIKFFTWYFFMGAVFTLPIVHYYQLDDPMKGFVLYLALWPLAFSYLMVKLLADPLLRDAGILVISFVVLRFYLLWEDRDFQNFVKRLNEYGGKQ